MDISSAITRIGNLFPERSGPTVDTVKHGDPAQTLRGIAVTFMATRAVIAQAAAAGANLIVTHEPTFWNHLDETADLEGDPVLAAKRADLDRGGLVVWRFHDRIHCGWPDDFDVGLARALGWEGAIVHDRAGIIRLPVPTTLAAVVDAIRSRLHAPGLRWAGDPTRRIATVALLPGAYGGRRQIGFLRQPDVDLAVCGEIAEWETCEYVRDAGGGKALVVLGHAVSEEPGMAMLFRRVCAAFPGTPVIHLPAGDPFAI